MLTAVKRVQTIGKGLVDKAVADANWLMDADSEIPKSAPPTQRQNEQEDQQEYHNMNVYTVGLGENVRHAGIIATNSTSTSDDDSSRDDVVPDTSSVTPAAPRRQNVTFIFGASGRSHLEQDKRSTMPKQTITSQERLPSSDSSSVQKVVHGTQVQGNRKAGLNKRTRKVFNKGSFVPWNEQAQSRRRQDKWTAASLNHYAEI
jgi:hypothetical protein